MEALSLLRQCTMARKTVREEKDYYVFGHRRVPKDTPTAWKSQVQSEVSVRRHRWEWKEYSCKRMP